MPHCECFDFPVSWDFWRAHCIEQHNYDPGSNVATKSNTLDNLNDRINNLEAITSKPDSLPKQYHSTLREIRAQINHTGNKLNAHLDRPRPKGKGLKVIE